MRKLAQIAVLLPRLGLRNVARVAHHRLRSRGTYFERQGFDAPRPTGPLFKVQSGGTSSADAAPVKLFGWFEESGDPPDWHSDPFSVEGVRFPSDLHWARLLRTLPPGTDLKRYWERSRFHWVTQFASEASAGNGESARRLERWLDDWVANNPPYNGVNWTCGQEAAIRLLHLAQAALLLGQSDSPTPGLQWLVAMHLRRVEMTIGYGLSQQNNHGATEAAALLVGGWWLFRATGEPAYGAVYRRGRRLLNRQVRVLVQDDGTSNQYSTNYHRSVLEACTFAQLWADRLAVEGLAGAARQRLANSAEAMRQLVDPRSGRVPNIGANDGSRILALPGEDVPDFRPAAELAATVFREERPFANIVTNRLATYGIAEPESVAPERLPVTFDDGGLHVLRVGTAAAFLLYPRFRFRPSQADGLHLDLWVDGENLLRDAGSYSYGSAAADMDFAGTAAHNTVELDGRDQMPRLGPFLFGSWLKARNVAPVRRVGAGVEAAAGYRDCWGAEHHRAVRLELGRLRCIDTLSGTASTAVLRWRLRPGDWRIDGNQVTDGKVRLTITAEYLEPRLTLTEGWESLLYLQKSRLPVVEAALPVPCAITTLFEFG